MENEVPLTISSPRMSEKSATSELRQEQVSAQPNRILSILLCYARYPEHLTKLLTFF